jgi:single-stranded-DNA-specific exonuclease
VHFKDQHIIVVSGKWHPGVMGIVASQLSERYGRPAIAIATDEKFGVGSGRSVPQVNLLKILEQCETLLVRYGGHAQACGVTLRPKDINEFRTRINEQAQRLASPDRWVKTSMADIEISLSEVEPNWIRETQQFGPFGSGNHRPTMIVRKLMIERKSARTALLSDGQRSCASSGTLEGIVPEGRYDVLAAARLTEREEVVMRILDVKGSEAL